MDIHEGDVASLREGSVFYIQSNLEAQRKKLRIYAMFTNTDDSTFVSSCTFILFVRQRFNALSVLILTKNAGSINWCLLKDQ
jgi:hypothetical protein